MVNPFTSISLLRSRRTLKKIADLVPVMDDRALRRARRSLRDIQKSVGRATRVADARLALPSIGSHVIDLPLHTNWSYRPVAWREPLELSGHCAPKNNTPLGPELAIFHNCPAAELTMRQRRNKDPDDLAPFALYVEVFGFEGSFLSLANAFPEEGIVGLKRRHLIRLGYSFHIEQPIDIFARLNVRHGPNTEELVREIPRDGSGSFVEFDLGATNIDENRIDAVWVDLIFEKPLMNAIEIRDLNFSRRPRAEV